MLPNSHLIIIDTLGPCLSNSACFPGVSCLNVGVGQSKCGPCPKGYEGDGRTCNDIDEVCCDDIDEVYYNDIGEVCCNDVDEVYCNDIDEVYYDIDEVCCNDIDDVYCLV